MDSSALLDIVTSEPTSLARDNGIGENGASGEDVEKHNVGDTIKSITGRGDSVENQKSNKAADKVDVSLMINLSWFSSCFFCFVLTENCRY